MLVEGQLVGGLAQGLGGALSEEFLYDSRGEPLSVTLADYLLPTLRDMPAVDILLTEDAPSPLNPLGIKSVGEGGITGVGAAIAAAIDDALGLPGGVTRLPATPQRIKALLRARQERSAEMTGPLLTLLDAPKLAAYTAAGWWGERDALRTCSPPQPGDARRLRDPRPGSPAELRGAGRRRRPARVLACGPRTAARRARRGMAAEPGRDRDRAAGLLAQLLCLLPVAAPRPHGRSGRGAGRPDARRRDDRAARLRRHDAGTEQRDLVADAGRTAISCAAPCMSGRPARRAFADLPGPAVDRPVSDDPNKITYLAFTSGTTGAPKGVLHSDNTLLASARMMARDWRLERAVLYTLSPLSHNLGLGAFITALAGGGELVVHDLPRGASLLDRLAETGAAFVFGVPTHAHDLLAEIRARGIGRVAGLRGFRISGAAAPPALIAELLQPRDHAAERLRHDRDLLAPIHTAGRSAGADRARPAGAPARGTRSASGARTIRTARRRRAKSARSAGAAPA